MQPHIQASLVTDVLCMAWFSRKLETGLILHSDRGSQYWGHAFQQTMDEYGMQSSMSSKVQGQCTD